MRKTKLVSAIIALILLVSGCSTHQATNYHEELVEPQTLKIGVEGTYKPYSYLDHGKLTGFEVDLGKAIAKELGLKPEFVTSKWDSLIAGLDVNKYDVVLNNVIRTKLRENAYAFSVPYIQGTSVLAVRSDNHEINKITDVKGQKLAQSITSNNATDAKRLGATVVPVDGFVQAIDLIDDGRVAGTINTKAAFYVYFKEQDNKKLKLISAGSEIAPYPVSAVLSKKDKFLLVKINKAIEHLTKDGTITRLSIKYFGDDVSK